MGSASSKATRQFPKTASKPTWAGARTQPPDEAGVPQLKQADQPSAAQRASETRTEAIEQDSRDPHFLAKLNRLGPVKVDHHMRSYQPAADLVQHVYQTRRESELEARTFRPSRNHLLTARLSELLDECKMVKSPQDLESLAQLYDIDVAKLENLRRLVNNPVVDPSTVVKTVGEDGEERVSMKVVWE
ncbi:hypothetical protein BC835DRAFT_1352715 [Cytidiella melzeri]|nr:hypothetical protein BC835DRAFT_1352715 [Cytidiella melzeri]